MRAKKAPRIIIRDVSFKNVETEFGKCLRGLIVREDRKLPKKGQECYTEEDLRWDDIKNIKYFAMLIRDEENCEDFVSMLRGIADKIEQAAKEMKAEKETE